jgi:hypothetical protein
MKALQHHRIQTAEPLADGRLRVTFADGWTAVAELAAFVDQRPVLRPLLAVFERATVGEWGFDVSWDAGGDLTIAATALRTLAEQQTGGPVGKFNDWMRRNGLSLSAAAESLGMTRRMIAHYKTGSRPIPKTVLLALKGWEAEQAELGGHKPQ